MPYIQYTAKREVIGAHTLGNSYGINFEITQHDKIREPIRTIHEALNGSSQTVYQRTKKKIVMTTDKIHEDDLTSNGWYEMLASIEGGEYFYFDPKGVYGVPVESVLVKVSSASSPVRIDDTNYFSITLEMVVQ